MCVEAGCCTICAQRPILPRDMVMIADLVCAVGVDGLLAAVALRLLVEVESETVVPL